MIRVGIVGASGYSGAELIRLLGGRPDVTIAKVAAGTSAGMKVTDLYPALQGAGDIVFETFTPEGFHGLDVVFVALPSGEGMNLVPQTIGHVDRVIDLGGDFRLPDAGAYEQYYGHRHTATGLLGEAVYGLPELNGEQIASARLVANPGCYATSAILALLPGLKSGLVTAGGIVIDSLSGVSGAGRSASFDMSFAEVNENVRAYKVGRHQHTPEIENVLARAAGESVTLSFVPHLAPLTRGIYTTIHARLARPCTDGEVAAVYESFYEAAPFVRMRKTVPQIKDVAYTNYCDVFLTVERRTSQLIIISAIDNLMKGAAGQAVQNMNIMLGLPEETGLVGKEFQHVE